MIPEPLKVYVRIQQIGPAVGNILCNVFLGWLGNRRMAPVTLFGDHAVVIDTVVTSIIASLLVTLFTTSGIHRDLRAGRLVVPPDIPAGKGLLYHLPHSAWRLGLTLGVGIALVLTALTLVVFGLFSVQEISAPWFLVIKGVYTGILGAFVARWVTLRQLMPDRPQPEL